ncbi:hypothetical protein ACQEUU_12755 [Nonomuraea sp. CA-218870]|uniref:hypothetical protein n=1 Tax=Nonomuraea sp. CA-218870 TaxID=3239998 RepID=UPI003D92B8CE
MTRTSSSCSTRPGRARPAYRDHGIPWGDAAESVAMAGQGAKPALSEHGARERFGLALYVDFAATEEDWREYEENWLS